MSLKISRRSLNALIAVLVVVLVVVLAKGSGSGVRSAFRVQVVEAYELVPDSISKDAAIVIALPDGVEKTGAESGVTFSPELEGEWLPIESERHIAFRPSRSLEVESFYSVTLESGEGVIEKDFQAAENPRIDAIFPHDGSHVSPDSSITIMFNRPMVALSTLGEMDASEVPVEITPETPGRFKWITTRNLQFIPEDGLYPSSRYVVSVKDMFSADGVEVAGADRSFKTWAIRISYMTDKTLSFDQPVRIHFSEPVDLERTKSYIRLKRAGSNLPITITYGSREVEDKKGKMKSEVENTILEVRPQQDTHGRKGLWDFATSYKIEVTQAHAINGSIPLERSRSSSFSVPSVISSIDVESERSSEVRDTIFDPEGSVEVTFAEEINLGKSDIEVKGADSIEYAKKCDDTEGEYFVPSRSRATILDCKTIDDKRAVVIEFKDGVYKPGDAINIEFRKLVNVNGLKLNSSPLTRTLRVYSPLTIVDMSPSDGEVSAKLRSLIVCTNTPLKIRESEEITDYIKASDRLVPVRWGRSYFIDHDRSYSGFQCPRNSFRTDISYGLLPETDYTLEIELEDHFDQKASKEVSFVTKGPDQHSQRIGTLNKQYNVTVPDRTKLTFYSENLPHVNLHVCKVSPFNFLSYLNNRPAREQSPGTLDCLSSATDVIDVPDISWVNQYFQIDISDYFTDPRGHYVISLSHPDYKSYRSSNMQYHRNYLSVTNISLSGKTINWSKYDRDPEQTKKMAAASGPSGNLYWVNDAKTLEGASGATVIVYKEGSSRESLPVPAVSGATNSEGVYTSGLVTDVVGAVAVSGDETAVLSGWGDNFSYASSLRSDERVYVYTDRPLYRPGHTVHIKGIYRVGLDGTFSTLGIPSVRAKVFNSRNEELLSKSLNLTQFGTFTADVALDQNAPLGAYRIEVEDRTVGYFDVQEYVGAAFEAIAQSQKEEYVAGEEATIDLSGRYYFGVPLDGGTVEYNFTTTDYHFDRYTDEYFNFGGGWYYCYRCGGNDRYLGRGTTELGDDGTAEVKIRLDFDELFREEDRSNSKIMVLHATITDSSGKQVSVQQSFIVHRGEYYLGAKTDPSYVGENEPFNVRVKTVDIDGEPKKVGNLTVSLEKVEWGYYKRKEVDGGYYNRWDKQVTTIASKRVSTNGKGDSSTPFTVAEAGSYQIRVSGVDSKGNQLETTTNVYVHGRSSVSVRPTNNATLEISAENRNLAVGDVAKMMIESPYEKAKALVTIERGKVLSYKIIDVNQNIVPYNFSVTKEHSPNIYASVLLLSPLPEVKYGNVEFNVDRDIHSLEIDVESNKEFYLPGEEVTLEISAKDYLGGGVRSELSLAAVDLSVLALKGNPKKNPLVFFYNGMPLAVMTSSNLKNILEEVDIPTGTKGGGGDGAGSPADLARKVRGEFRDTAFWSGNVVTDESGRATVTFTLPDNLTRWQVEALGVTEDTKLGTDYKEFTARKDLMTIPLAPRFVVPGDEFYLGAKVFNQTDKSQKLEVSLSDTTFELLDGDRRSEKVSAGETKTVYFKLRAPRAMDEGWHKFTLSAQNRDYEDTVIRSVQITPNTTYEATATAGATKKDYAREYFYVPPEASDSQGGIEIRANATMAVYLSDALGYMIRFPYGCTEQMASKLAALGVISHSLNIPNVGDKFDLPEINFGGETYSVEEAVEEGLNRIYKNQTPSGGFAYYSNLEPRLHLSIHILDTLRVLRDAGFKVDPSVMAKASRFIEGELQSFDWQRRYRTEDRIFAAYVLAESGYLKGTVDALIKSRLNRKYMSEEASTPALAYIALLGAKGHLRYAKEDAFRELENRVTIDGRGAYVKSHRDYRAWDFYETNIKNTALLLKAYSENERDSKLLPNLNRWLLGSRHKDGAWGSTNNTLSVIDAFTSYLKWTRETEAEYDLAVMIAGDEQVKFQITDETVLDTFTEDIPMDELEISRLTKVEFERERHNDLETNFYYDMSLKYFLPADQIPARDEGMTVERNLYEVGADSDGNPIVATDAKVGDVLRGELVISVPKDRRLVGVEDMIPAGFELINFDFATEDKSLFEEVKALGVEESGVVARANRRLKLAQISPISLPPPPSLRPVEIVPYEGGLYNRGLPSEVRQIVPSSGLSVPGSSRYYYRGPHFGGSLHASYKELHDDRLFLFIEYLPAGVYKYEYYIRATTPGTFHHLPAVASELYYPEVFGRTAASIFEVEK